jgi:hypothetical protein
MIKCPHLDENVLAVKAKPGIACRGLPHSAKWFFLIPSGQKQLSADAVTLLDEIFDANL